MRIEARVVGRRGPPDVRDVPWPPRQGGTVRALIDRVVRSEVAAFEQRQDGRSLLRVLTEAEVTQQAEAGAVRAEVRARTTSVDPDQAVATALEAFTDGLFLLFVDGAEVDDLDTPVPARDALEVRFVRVVPLAGGCR